MDKLHENENINYKTNSLSFNTCIHKLSYQFLTPVQRCILSEKHIDITNIH